jgi:hypothetical protein
MLLQQEMRNVDLKCKAKEIRVMCQLLQSQKINTKQIISVGNIRKKRKQFFFSFFPTYSIPFYIFSTC